MCVHLSQKCCIVVIVTLYVRVVTIATFLQVKRIKMCEVQYQIHYHKVYFPEDFVST